MPSCSDDGAHITRWAPVEQAIQARERPSSTSPVVVDVSTTTPEGTSNLVDVDGEVTTDGVTWVHARLAVLPDGRTGWLPRTALGGWSFVNTHVVVNRETLTLTLYRGAKVVFRTPSASANRAHRRPLGSSTCVTG